MSSATPALLRYRLQAHLESPAAISTRRATGNVLGTRTHIPGSMIRGALAAAMVSERGPDISTDPWFRALFADGGLRCSDLRINDSVPWPRSVLQCKEHGGDRDHACFDFLLAAAAGLNLTHPADQCRTCRAKLETPEGYSRYYKAQDEHRSRDHSDPVKTVRVAHVQMDPRYGRARNGMLYSAESVAKDQGFIGFMQLPGGAWDWLFPGTEVAVQQLWIGRGRSRGQGCLRLEAFELASPETAETLLRRIEALNRKVASVYPKLADALVFTCVLHSAAILFDRWLLPRQEPTAADFGLGEEFRLLAAFSRQESVTGWHQQAELPKSELVVTAAGSCFVFGRDVLPSERDEATRLLASALHRVHTAGLGERTEDGFGEVSFCDPIHERLLWNPT